MAAAAPRSFNAPNPELCKDTIVTVERQKRKEPDFAMEYDDDDMAIAIDEVEEETEENDYNDV